MNRTFLIPIAAFLVGCIAPDPDDEVIIPPVDEEEPPPPPPNFLGDWEMKSFTLYGAGGGTAVPQTGELSVEEDGDAELSFTWLQGYHDTYSMEMDGKAEENPTDATEFTLTLDGFFHMAGTYSIEADLDCEIDGDDLECDGEMPVSGGLVIGASFEFERD